MNSHITGVFDPEKLSLKNTHKVTSPESDHWGFPEGELVQVVPNTIKIEESRIDSLQLMAFSRDELGVDSWDEVANWDEVAKYGLPVVFQKKVKFTATTFNEKSVLENGIFARGAYFSEATFKDFVFFSDIDFVPEDYEYKLEEDSLLEHYYTIEEGHTVEELFMAASFKDTKFKEGVRFSDIEFRGGVPFYGADFTGGSHFKRCKFWFLENRSTAMRLATMYWRQLGSERWSSHYFYKYMKAERAQKPFPVRWAEYILVDLTCKYGMSWRHVLVSWIVIIFVSALGYWLSKGLKEGPYPKPDLSLSWFAISLYFSVVTFTRSGSRKYEPRNQISKTISIIETVIGAFFRALFVLVFASAFMR